MSRAAEARGAWILPAMVLAWGVACSAPAERQRTPLLDPLHEPDILTESRVLAMPPSQGPTRFVRGWWGWREDGVLRMVPYARPSRVEIATLEPRPRTLRFVTEVNSLPAEGKVTVQVGGETVAELPLDPDAVELPPLPVGRAPVDFLWPPDSGVGIERAELDEALPAGRVTIDATGISQSGYSAVDLVRRLPAGARLTGSFSPPPAARDAQSFALVVEREGAAPETLYSWPRPWWRRWGDRRFDVPLTETEGLVRVRLLARATGEQGRWEDLVIESPPAPAREEAPAPPPPRLVLLYVMDALRADTVGHLGGGEGITPVLDRLAREGVTFLDHQSLAPNTLPSTKTLFTGRPVLESNRERLSPSGPPLLAELFRDAGYATSLLSGNGFVSHFYGVTRGFEHQDDGVLYEFHPKTDYNDNAEWIHAAAREWLGGLEPGARAFLYLQTIHPHGPYDPPAAFRPAELAELDSSIAGDLDTLEQVRSGERPVSPDDRRRLELLYRGSLAYNDARLGELLEWVLPRYEPGDVLVLVTSDHGEELLDHDGVLHGYTLHGDQLQVPLIAWWPGTLQPHRVSAATTTQDLYVTLRRLTGEYEPPHLSGRSLWPLMLGADGDAEERVRFAAAPGVAGGIYSARSSRRKLIWAPRTGSQWGMGEGIGRSHEAEYVFDLVADPDEQSNLAGERSLETDWLRSRLFAWIELGRVLQPGGEEVELDEAMERNLRALGYID